MNRRRLAILLCAASVAAALAAPAASDAAAVDGNGMWIWYVSRSSGGTPDGIAAKAARYGIKTVYIKAADGRDPWRQFSPALVGALKARGLRVCAWQFVYGRYPKTEAARGAEAARAGADCLVIDAEGQYEGKYVSAQTYMRTLRSLVGSRYELALTGFPYVNLHPAFPYSVFLGPGAATRNLPQMYWKTIGVSVDRIYQATYTYNRVYGRRIYPLGQTYLNPSSGSVKRFRLLARTYGARGLSWWVWQFSGARQWTALGSAFDPIGAPRRRDTWPLLSRGTRSDLVVWAQRYLMSLGLLNTVNGNFGAGTQRAVLAFQGSRGLLPTGRLDEPTWRSLLRSAKAAKVNWSSRRRSAVRAARSSPRTFATPLNARVPAVRDELAGKPGP